MCCWNSSGNYLIYIICPFLSKMLYCVIFNFYFIVIGNTFDRCGSFKSNHVLSTSHKLIMSCWLCNISSKSIFKTISFKCERCTGEIFTIIVFICISIIDICSIIFFITQFRIFRYILTIHLIGFYPNILVGINIF